MSRSKDEVGCYTLMAWIGVLVIILLVIYALSGGPSWLRLALLLQVLV